MWRIKGTDKAMTRWGFWFWLAAGGLTATLWAGGQMQPWVLPDTPSYLGPPACPGCLGGMRLPVYGWLVGFAGGESTLPLWPWLHLATLVLAASSLGRALARAGLSGAACLAAALSVAVSTAAILWGRGIVPEIPSNAAAIAALAATIDGAFGAQYRRALVRAAGFLALAYLLKPNWLPLALALPLLLALLRRSRGVSALPALWLLAAGFAPFLAVSGVRLATLGDFNIVSFGGFQMAGMASLILTPDTVDRLPAEDRALARNILRRRGVLEAAGAVAPIPRNSSGERSFASAAIGYFDILARAHDTVLFEAVIHERSADESWVAFNARAQRFAIAVLLAEKPAYAAWVLGATVRLTGRMLAANPPFLLWSAALGAWFLWSRARDAPMALDVRPNAEVAVLVLIVGAYTGGAGALSVLATFPAGRYADSAGMLLALFPAYALLRQVPALAEPADGRGEP